MQNLLLLDSEKPEPLFAILSIEFITFYLFILNRKLFILFEKQFVFYINLSFNIQSNIHCVASSFVTDTTSKDTENIIFDLSLLTFDVISVLFAGYLQCEHGFWSATTSHMAHTGMI